MMSCAIAGLATACAGPPAPTQIFVVIDSRMLVPDELDTVLLEIERPPDAPLGPYTQIVDPAKRFAVELPVTVTLTSRSEEAREVIVTARAVRRDEVRVVRRARATFVLDEIQVLCLELDPRCAGVSCDAGETCVEGACRDMRVELEPLSNTDAQIHACAAFVARDAGAPPSDASIDGGDDGGGLDGGDAAIDGALPLEDGGGP